MFGLGLAVAAGLGLAELGLRLRYPAPPSLAALEQIEPGAAERDATTAGCRDWRAVPSAPVPTPQHGQKVLYIGGDSVAAGWGVAPDASFPARIEQAFVRGGQFVDVVNDAHPGASLCDEIARFRGVLQGSRVPSWAVIGVFADDLVRHGAMYVDGRLVAFPSAERPEALAVALRSSWLLNLGWFAWISRHPGRLDGALPGSLRDAVVRSLAETDGAAATASVKRVWVLLPGVNQALCPADADPPGVPASTPAGGPRQTEAASCRALGAGLRALREVFAEARVPLLDLDGVYGDGAAYLLERERFASPPTAVAVHPNEAGHQLLADRILPALGR